MLSLLYSLLKKFGVSLAVWTVAFMVFVPTVYTLGPIIETKYFPVITNFTVDSVLGPNAKDGILQLYGKLDKTRQCDIREFNWYVGDPQQDFIRIYSKFNDSHGSDQNLVTRPKGVNYFGPWDIGTLELKKYHYKIFAVASHSCHPFWNTLSIVGPIDISKMVPQSVLDAIIPEK